MPPVPATLERLDVTPPPAVIETVALSLDGDTQRMGYERCLRAANAQGDHPLPPPEPGTRIDSYIVHEKLGEGASCHVFRGWDQSRLHPVALKLINWANVHDSAAALRQLRAEAVALARVNHASIVRFLDFGLDARWPYLVTEYIPGSPLGELLRAGALPAPWALYMMSQVADALGAVWRAGLVHRDVKADNILIGAEGRATLIDFGLARSVQSRDAHSPPELAGTVGYLAPEQAKDASRVDHRADIYGLGVTLYQALTGRLPFEGRTRMQVIYQHMSAAPVAPHERVPEVPAAASDLCMWMLAKNPADRPRDQEELRRAFDAVMGAVG
jgi:serine/threonine-protein kinase